MVNYLVFRLGTEEFGINIDRVVEIINAQKVCEVPDLRDFIAGVVSLRGKVIPLIDMRKRFSIESAPVKERTILVRTKNETLGLIVDEVMEIMALRDDEISMSPTIFRGLSSEYLEGLGKKDGRVVILLDLENILTHEERIALDESKNSIKGANP